MGALYMYEMFVLSSSLVLNKMLCIHSSMWGTSLIKSLWTCIPGLKHVCLIHHPAGYHVSLVQVIYLFRSLCFQVSYDLLNACIITQEHECVRDWYLSLFPALSKCLTKMYSSNAWYSCISVFSLDIIHSIFVYCCLIFMVSLTIAMKGWNY